MGKRDRNSGGALPECRRGVRAAWREAGDALCVRQPGRSQELPPGDQASPLISSGRRAARPGPAAQPRHPSPPPRLRLDGRPLGGHHVRRAADAALLLTLPGDDFPRGLPWPPRLLDVANARLAPGLGVLFPHAAPPFPYVTRSRLPERAVVDLLLTFEGFLAAGKRLEVAATVQHVDPVDVVASHLQFRQIDVVDLARFSRPKTGGCHGRIVSPPPAG